jgi:hypothetical protein
MAVNSFRLLKVLVERSLARRKALFHFPYRWKWAPEFAGLDPDAEHRTFERRCVAQG